MLKFVLLIPAVVLLAFGTEGLYNAFRGRDMANMTCAQLRQAPPPSLRLHLTGCEIDYKGAAYRESNGSIEELILPVRASGAPSNQPAPLVVATRTPAVVAIAQPLLTPKDQAAGQPVQTMEKAAAAAGVTKEISGLVRAGFVERIAARQVLAGLSTPLAENVMVLDLNATPDFVWPAVLALLGLALLVTPVILAHRSRSVAPEIVPESGDRASVLERLLPYAARVAESAEPSPNRAVTPAEPSPAADSTGAAAPTATSVSTTPSPTHARTEEGNHVRLPRVMLLKLDSSAGPEAIEMAPPLGTRDDVAARLREVFPDLEIDQTGRGAHEGPDHALAVDLGRHETVHTAILDARGETGITAVRWVLETTGWRAFVPKAGRFVDADALEDFIIRDPA